MTDLTNAFAYHRAKGRTAERALKLARLDVSDGTKRYPSSGAVFYNRGSPGHVRWIENVSDGLRVVGFADEVARAEGCPRSIDHKGWYTNEFQDETMRGQVFSLSHARYVAGYADPCNEDCARVDFGEVYTDKMEAARAADSFAQRCAERERDYQDAWQKGLEFCELGEERKQLRANTRDILAGIAALPRDIGRAVRDTCLNVIRENRQRVREIDAKRRDLRHWYGHTEAFKEHVR